MTSPVTSKLTRPLTYKLTGSLGAMPGGGGGMTPPYVPTNAEAAALFAAMEAGGVPLSDDLKAIDDTLIGALKATSLFQISDLLYFAPSTTMEAQSLLDWTTPGTNTLIPTASPTYIAGQGWKGDGVGAYYDTGLAANAAGLNFKQDDASMSWAAFDNVQRIADVGAASSAMASGVGRTSSDLMAGRLASSSQKTTANANGQGMFCISKTDATHYTFYINGVPAAVVASGSTALTANNFTILRVSGAFAPNTVRVGYYRIGKHVTDTQALDEYNAVRTATRAVDTSLLP